MKPNLTFSYGIRMEAQNAINSSHDFAPRLAIAYGVPRKNGKTTTVIRGGFGVFFNRFGLGSIEGQIANNGVNAENYTYHQSRYDLPADLQFHNGRIHRVTIPAAKREPGQPPRSRPR